MDNPRTKESLSSSSKKSIYIRGVATNCEDELRYLLLTMVSMVLVSHARAQSVGAATPEPATNLLAPPSATPPATDVGFEDPATQPSPPQKLVTPSDSRVVQSASEISKLSSVSPALETPAKGTADADTCENNISCIEKISQKKNLEADTLLRQKLLVCEPTVVRFYKMDQVVKTSTVVGKEGENCILKITFPGNPFYQKCNVPTQNIGLVFTSRNIASENGAGQSAGFSEVCLEEVEKREHLGQANPAQGQALPQKNAVDNASDIVTNITDSPIDGFEGVQETAAEEPKIANAGTLPVERGSTSSSDTTRATANDPFAPGP